VSKVDPKKDPARRCLKVGAWPHTDQRAWAAALQDGNIFEPAGCAAGWAPRTRNKVAVANLARARRKPGPGGRTG
jgi:hypothetical protein